jgi:sulfate adenylyltransferase subunit 2
VLRQPEDGGAAAHALRRGEAVPLRPQARQVRRRHEHRAVHGRDRRRAARTRKAVRSKERYFSPRSGENNWNIADQPPEFWNQYATEFAPGTHVRIHPLLDWTELDIWEYIERERIPTVSLYYDQGKGERYRSLGCWPCTKSVTSDARNVQEIIVELKSGRFANIAERSGRAQDKDDGGGLESLRREGYM